MILLRVKATAQQIPLMTKQYSGYIKVVIDIQRHVLVGGAERHVDEEQRLLADGSRQEDLWGGGVDINIRPAGGNPSRDIMDTTIRKQFDAIVKELLL